MHRYHESRRSYILRVLRGAREPMTLLQIDTAMSQWIPGQSTPQTRNSTSAALALMIDAGLVIPEGRPRHFTYRLAGEGEQRPQKRPRAGRDGADDAEATPPKLAPSWRPLVRSRPYRREQRAAPGIHVQPPSPLYMSVGPSARD